MQAEQDRAGRGDGLPIEDPFRKSYALLDVAITASIQAENVICVSDDLVLSTLRHSYIGCEMQF
jgi:hypothetical protein